MNHIFLFALYLLFTLPITEALAGGDDGGSGGGPADSYNTHKLRAIQIFAAEDYLFRFLFRFNEEEYEKAIERAEKVIVRERSSLGNLLIKGKKVSVARLLPKPVNQLFAEIDGEPKLGVNLTVRYKKQKYDLIIFDNVKCEKKHDTELKKVGFMGHEILGLLKVEKTGRRDVSDHITQDMLDNVPKWDIPLLMFPFAPPGWTPEKAYQRSKDKDINKNPTRYYQKKYDGIKYVFGTNEDYSDIPNVEIVELTGPRMVLTDFEIEKKPKFEIVKFETILFQAIARVKGKEYWATLLIPTHYPKLAKVLEKSMQNRGRGSVRIFYQNSYGNLVVRGVQKY